MTQLAKGILRLFRGEAIADEGWHELPDVPLTPREAMLRRTGSILRWAGIINALVGFLVIFLTVIAATNNNELFESLQSLLLSNFQSTEDTALLIAILFVFGNTAILLLFAVGILAQEFWTVVAIWIFVLVNLAGLVVLGFLPGIIPILAGIWASLTVIRDIRAFRTNPVMLKELRGRMRGVRSFTIVTVYLSLMSIFTVLLYFIRLPLSGTVVTGELGRVLFLGVIGTELLLIIFIVPALTAGAITGERERKTYDLLQTTLLPSPSFIVGKMQSALGYIFILLLSAIPLQSIAFLFGGVAEAEMILAFIVLAVTAFTLGAVGMFFSATTERTLTATIRSYTTAMIVAFGVPVVALMLFQGAYNNAVSNIATGLGSTPHVEATYIYLDMILAGLNPITATLYSQQMLIDHQQFIFMSVTLSTDGTQIPVLSPWILLTISYLTTSAILLMLAMRQMRRQTGN